MLSQLASQFFLASDAGVLVMYGSYHPVMVIVSIAIAVMAAMMAMQLAGMAQQHGGTVNPRLSIASGAVVLGAGVWSMHFIGIVRR